MWYLIRNEMRGKNAWYFFASIVIVIFQVAGNVILPLLLNYLTQVLTGKAFVRIADNYYDPSTHLLTAEGQRVEAVILMVIMLAIGIVTFIAGTISGVLGSRVAIYMTRNMRIKMYNKIQAFSHADLDKFRTASLITRLTTDVFTVQEALVFILRVGFRALFLYVGGIIGTIIVVTTAKDTPADARHWEWVVPVIVIISSAVTLTFISIVIYKSAQLNQKKMVVTDETNNVMREAILGVRVIKSFNLQDLQKEKFANVNGRLAKAGQKALFAGELGFPVVTLIMNVTVAAVLGLGTKTETIGITEVITLVQLITLMMVGLILFVVVLGQIGASAASAKRMKEVATHEPSITYDKNGPSITDGSIEFKNVSFRYSKTGEPVLKDINLKINPNETIGIIGGTGSGKSTLVNLIARLYDITEGELKVSGIEVNKINEISLRKEIAMSPQEVTIFSGTIASNLKYGKPDATEEDMVKAAKIAEAYSFIEAKENGFNSVVEQRGRNFSGGQKQRLSIARAVIKDAKILILDDSTSALDMITEKNVQHNLKTEKTNLTKVFVAQRISAVKNADKIVVLDNGRIVGYGKHQELLRTSEIYREIALSQLGEEGVRHELGQQH